jgi:selenocysteine-specific elongation factor
VRLDELATKMPVEKESLLRLLAARLAERGELISRDGVLLGADSEAPPVSPMGRQLLRDMKSAGPIGLELSKLKVEGVRKELRNLVRSGLAVGLQGDIYYEREIYLGLVRKILAGLTVSGTLTIAQTKERTGLSRKYVIPLLNRMESDGFVKRSGDERVVTALPD